MFLIDDFLNAWRGLRHTPGFLVLASTVLALGLGVTIFTYAAIEAATRRPPPFPEAERLYSVLAIDTARDGKYASFQVPDFTELAKNQRSFDGLAAYYTGTSQVTLNRHPERVVGGRSTANLMRVLGVKPLLGRDFIDTDNSPDAPPVVILGHDFWRTRLYSDPEVIGRIIRVDGQAATVIGVMPPEFTFGASLWLPMAHEVPMHRRGDHVYDISVVGRLAAGVTPERARVEAAQVFERLASLYPHTNAGVTATVVPLAGSALHDARRAIGTLFGAVSLVLLVACANVASLLFVRANSRVYEASLRVALGARRPRLIVQMLAESTLIAALGVIGGLVLASIGLYLTDVAMRSLVDKELPPWWDFSIDGRVILFAIGVALVSSLLAGIVPALRASRPDVMRILRDGGRTGTGLRLNRFTTAMVIVEVALSAALLTGAGLMTRASVLTLQPDYGADVSGFMSARIGLPLAKYPEAEQGRFFERLTAELRTRPGVLAATAATVMPGTGAMESRFGITGETYLGRTDYPRSHTVLVTSGFFDAFGLRMLRGREFTPDDRADSPRVVVVNQAFAERYFPGRDPLGETLYDPENQDHLPITIVGVAPNINHDNAWKDDGFTPTLYLPVTQRGWAFLTVAIRTAGDPRAFGELLRKVTQEIDPDLAPYWMQTLEETQLQRRGPLRLLSAVFSGFALIAVILAGVGIYGVLAFATGQRNREIGVRRALGARDRQILMTVMRSALLQLAIGLGLGALFAPLLTRALNDALDGVSPDDPAVYIAVVVLLVVAALLASWLPARRALRVQPSSVLRCE